MKLETASQHDALDVVLAPFLTAESTLFDTESTEESAQDMIDETEGLSNDATAAKNDASSKIDDIDLIIAEMEDMVAQSEEAIANMASLDGWLEDIERMRIDDVPDCYEDGDFFGMEFIENRWWFWAGHQCETEMLVLTLTFAKGTMN